MTQKQVVSIESEATREISNLDINIDTHYRFSLSEIFGKNSTETPMLRKIYASKLFDDYLSGVEALFTAQINQDESETGKAISKFYNSVLYALERSEQNLDELNLLPLIQTKNNISKFQDGEINELTLISTIHYDTVTIESLTSYIEQEDIQLNYNSNVLDAESENSLRFHRSKFTNKFLSDSVNLTRKYKRTLIVSMRKNEKSNKVNRVSLRVKETQMEPQSIWQRIHFYFLP